MSLPEVMVGRGTVQNECELLAAIVDEVEVGGGDRKERAEHKKTVRVGKGLKLATEL